MLLVKTEIKQSEIHGTGLFANEFIAKGAVIFKESLFTKHFTEDEYNSLPELQKQFIAHYCYFLGGVWRCSMDNDRFTNHSDTPNTIEQDYYTTIAAVDINIGDEITADYSSIFDNFKINNNLKQ